MKIIDKVMILATAVKQPKHLLDCFYPQIRPDKGRPGHTDMALPAEGLDDELFITQRSQS
jgi:hypothetical protein